jgi:ankyrin repeat protein
MLALDLVKLLIEKGADVNLRMGEDGETAIYYAVHENNLEIVKLLVELGARVKILDYVDNTPIDHVSTEYDGYDNKSAVTMREYLQDCFDKEDTWYDEERVNRALIDRW